jgi:RNA polymerase sigma factor (sigma-70 family)
MRRRENLRVWRDVPCEALHRRTCKQRRLYSLRGYTANDPEVALQEKSRSERLKSALTRLSPEHGEIIDLVYYHEKSIAECAEIIGIPAATVKTRMFYARKRLAELVKDV